MLQAGELGRGSTWGALALRCHLTNPQENPNHLLLPWELEFCVSGMQKHRNTQERASRQSEKDLLFGPLTCRRHDKPVKAREGSSGGVKEAPVLGIPMKTSCFCSSVFRTNMTPSSPREVVHPGEIAFDSEKASSSPPAAWRGRALLLWRPTPAGRVLRCFRGLRPGEKGDWGAHVLALNVILGPQSRKLPEP